MTTDYSAVINMGKHLLRLIDTPDLAMGWRGIAECHERPFNCFKKAYGEALKKTHGGALAAMSQQSRLELKLALREDIRAIFNTEEEEAPKLLQVAPDEPSALSVLEQIASIKVRIARLGEAKAALEAMVAKIESTLSLPDKAFTTMPPPTEMERAEKRPKRSDD